MNNIKIINALMVNIFDDILNIEGKAIGASTFNDLTVTEMHVLEAIGINKKKSMTEIATNLKVTVGTLTTSINRLVKKGYVDRRRQESDKRVVRVFLTSKGKSAYMEHEKFHKEMIESMIKGLNIDNQLLLIQSLRQIKQFMKDKYKN